jgi:hypothetical protein
MHRPWCSPQVRFSRVHRPYAPWEAGPRAETRDQSTNARRTLGGYRHRAATAALAITVGLLAFAGSAPASGDRVIEVQDACDPATFNAAGLPPQPNGAPTCDRVDSSGKRVTFAQLFASIAERGSHGAWKFDRDKVTINRGDAVVARLADRAGEFHSFTEVPQFGPAVSTRSTT